jgi:hypothetical protein
VQKIGKFSSFANGHHFLSKETKKRLKRKLFFLFIHWRFKTFCGNIASKAVVHARQRVRQTNFSAISGAHSYIIMQI